MSDLHQLREAFEELERRADAVTPHDLAITPARRHRPARSLLAPAATVAAVALITVGVAVWHNGDHGSRPAGQQAAGQPTTPATQLVSAPPVSVQPSADTSSRFQPPTTPAQVAATARAILAGTATITVTETGYPVQITLPGNPTAPSSASGTTPAAPAAPAGAAISGTLTSAGRTGGFDLNVMAAGTGTPRASCDFPTDCTRHTLADGSSLAVSTWHDPSVPGGVTYEVELVRPDGADILLHVSTEHSPKGASTVTADRAPLTVDQMIDFVMSGSW